MSTENEVKISLENKNKSDNVENNQNKKHTKNVNENENDSETNSDTIKIFVRSLQNSEKFSINSEDSSDLYSSLSTSSDDGYSRIYELNQVSPSSRTNLVEFSNNCSFNQNPINTNQNDNLNITNLAFDNSSDITIGNKTIHAYNGPIIINQSTQEKDEPKYSKKCRIITISVLIFCFISIITATTCALLIKTYTDTEEDISPESWNIRIVNRTEWKADPPKDELESFVTVPFRALIGHTAGLACVTEEGCKQVVKGIQKLMMNDGYYDIGYNFLVGGDGMIYEGCGWNKIGQHTFKFNNNSICIALMGDFMKIKPSVKQIKATQWILEECVKNQKLLTDYKLYGVRQVYPSQSPGDEVYSIITKWSHWTDVVT